MAKSETMAASAGVHARAVAARATRQLLRSQIQCVLATVCADTHAPSTHLMAFGLASDLGRVFLATEAGTQKATNMRRSPAVSLLWDDRTGRLEDHAVGTLCTASGTARVLDAGGAECKVAQRAVLTANSNFGDFMSSPTIALFAVDVARYDLVIGYGSPVSWHPGSTAPSL